MATHKISTEFPDQPCAELISDDEDYDVSWKYPIELMIYFPEGEGKLKIVAHNELIVDLDINHIDYFNWVTALVQQNIA
jgi:hypothetical protein